jgi:hypothetical protein
MSRRLLTAGLSLAVLLGAQSGFGRITAKPPDLPLVDNDVLNIPLLISEGSDATAPNRIPVVDAPTAAPAMEIPMLFQLRPSVRRTIASCVLFGVHPLLALAPTEEYLDLDEDDWSSATPPALVKPATKEDASSNCPYMRQQQCVPDRHAVLFADPDFSRDVLQNLEALRQSREMLEKARQLGRSGRVIEALDALSLAADLCPGSRFEEEIQATVAQILSQCSETEREIHHKLSRPVTLNVTDAPLRQVLDDLHGMVAVNIFVDAAALEAEEVSLDRRLSVKAENIPLRSVLAMVLKEVHLTYRVKNEVVLITTERSQRAAVQPSLPPIDAGVPTALDHLLYETLKAGWAAGGGSEEQEARVEAPPQGSFEFGFGLDGGLRMFTQFQHGGDIWHLEFNQNGLKWWALPEGGAEVEPHRCTGFNLEQAPAPSQQ